MANEAESLQAGKALIEQGKVAEAMELLTEALAQDGQQMAVRVLLAKLKAATGDLDGFKNLADEALRIAMAAPESYLLKGMSAAFQGDYEEAIKFYEMALAKDD